MTAYDARALKEIVCAYSLDGRFVRISPAKYRSSPLTYGTTPSGFSGPPTVANPAIATFGALYLAATVKGRNLRVADSFEVWQQG